MNLNYNKEYEETDDNYLESKEALQLRIEQLSLNCKWLIDKFNEIHDILCPNENGSWQDIVNQSVKAIRKQNNETNKINRRRC